MFAMAILSLSWTCEVISATSGLLCRMPHEVVHVHGELKETEFYRTVHTYLKSYSFLPDALERSAKGADPLARRWYRTRRPSRPCRGVDVKINFPMPDDLLSLNHYSGILGSWNAKCKREIYGGYGLKRTWKRLSPFQKKSFAYSLSKTTMNERTKLLKSCLDFPSLA